MELQNVMRDLVTAYAARTPVERVAVVANAPLPPSEQRAELIDSCDLVFRINGFALDDRDGPPTLGTRADVVTFTRGFRATPWFFRNYRDRLYLLVEPGRMHWEPELIPDWWPRDLGWVPVPNREVTIPLSEAIGIDSVRFANWATTGTVTAWLAHALFPDAELHLAGFSFITDPEQTSWEHAFGEPCDISSEHLLVRESDLLRTWAADGVATVHA